MGNDNDGVFSAVSLFSGVGGFDLALEHCGIEVTNQIEIDKNCQSILEHHFPNAKRHGDIKLVKKEDLPAGTTLFVGGFPCTDLSVAGRREGLAGDASGLWFEFHRLITEVKPAWVLIENVPGLLSSNFGRDFAVVVAGLTGILPDVPENGWGSSGFFRGRKNLYSISYRIFDSQYAGVPQRRRRVFIVGHISSGRAAQVLFEFESGAWNPPPSRKARQGTSTYAVKGAAIGHKPENGPQRGEVLEDQSFTLNATEVHAIVEADRFATSLYLHGDAAQNGSEVEEPRIAGTLSASGAGSARPAGNANETDLIIPVEYFGMRRSDDYREASVDATLASRDYKSAADLVAVDLQQVTSKVNRVQPSPESPPLTTNGSPIVFEQQSEAPFFVEAIDVRNSESNGDISGTLRVSGSATEGVNPGKPDHWCSTTPFGVRRLTPIETERLQNFPDDWTRYGADGKEMSDSVRYRMMGNAVTVSVVEWIIRRIMEVDKQHNA